MRTETPTTNPLLEPGKTVKVLVIDPIRLEISEKPWILNDFDAVRKWVGADILDHVTGPIVKNARGCLFVDDLGLHKKYPRWKWSAFTPHTLAGPGVLFGISEESGDVIDVPYTIHEILVGIQWQLIIPLKDGPGIGHA